MLLTDDKCYSRITVPYFFLNPKAEALHSQDSLDLSPGLWRSSPRRRCLQMLGCLCLSLLIHKSRRTPWVSVLSLQETSRRRPTGGPSIYVLQPQPWLSTEHCPSTQACMYVFCLTPRAMPTSNFPHFRPVTTASSPPWTFRSHREERPSQCGYCNFPRCQLHPHPSLPPPQMESSISSPVEQSSTPLTVSLGFFSP